MGPTAIREGRNGKHGGGRRRTLQFNNHGRRTKKIDHPKDIETEAKKKKKHRTL